MISEKLLQISGYEGEGYQPLVRYEGWRVAILRYCDELLPENIDRFQRHDLTDEVFVLLDGHCTLYLADGEDEIGEINAQPLEPMKLYNVKKGAWHSHTLNKDATVLVIENDNTQDYVNSPYKSLTAEQRKRLIELVR